MGSLDGKVAMITGAASGIGLATAERFAAEGASVVLVDRNADAGEKAAAEVGGVFMAGDVGSSADWVRLVAETEAAFGGIDIAYLNAGVLTGEGDIAAISDEQYRRIVGANVDGVVFGTRAVTPAIASRGGGAIVATASLAGLIAFAPDPIYTLTKHAVVGFVRAVAPQLALKNITINCVCPGVVDTPLAGPAREMLRESGFPLIDPSEIADAVLACATGTATGQPVMCRANLAPAAYEFAPVPGLGGLGD